MPKQYRIKYFLTPTFPCVVRDYGSFVDTKGTTYAPDVTAWCDRLSANPKHSGNPSDRRDLEEVCKLVTDSMQIWRKKLASGLKDQQPFNSTDIARVVVASADLDNKERFLEAFEICPYGIPASTFKSVVATALRHKLASILPKYVPLPARPNFLIQVTKTEIPCFRTQWPFGKIRYHQCCARRT